jgi:predicted PhzF superfamily epimerase YddE/YHI9
VNLPAVLVEAFAERPCQGNGAAVVLLRDPLPEPLLQALARSFNQSETAFLLPSAGRWLLRWFTPHCEVPLCGHATLAALLALGHWGLVQPGEALALISRSGSLPVRLHPSRASAGSLELPSGGLEPIDPPGDLVAWLSKLALPPPLRYWRSQLGYRVALLSAAAPLEHLRLLPADLPAAEREGLVLMQQLSGEKRPRVQGLPADYQLRFLAPGLGIPEDPVTGSAHALVAPYWQAAVQRDRVVGWQCSDRPGGMLCEAASSGMIRLCGSGHLLWNGSVNIDGWEPSGQPPGCGAGGDGWTALRV